MKKSSYENWEIFSRNLVRYMNKKEKNQREVALAIGVTPATFNDWIKGRTFPRMDKIELLAEYFGINKFDLIDDVNFAKETVSDEDQVVLDMFHEIPKEKRADAIALCKDVLNNLSKFW